MLQTDFKSDSSAKMVVPIINNINNFYLALIMWHSFLSVKTNSWQLLKVYVITMF